MTERFATTPFGGGRMSASIFRQQQHVERRRAAVREGGNDTGRADKWQLLRALSEARLDYDLSDRAVVVLEALLSFHPEREIDGSQPIIVFPSNAELSARARGMADPTLRRHLAALVKAGLIQRRDSPNGKRYCQRDHTGTVENAFGFDLSPLALAAPGIHEAAEAVKAHERACRKVRGEITIHLRDIAKVIEAGLGEKRAGDWEGFSIALMPLAKRPSRIASRELLNERREALIRLRAEVEKAYLDSLDDKEMSGNDIDFERHYQNSKSEPYFENSSEKELKREAGQAEASESPGEAPRRAPEIKGEAVPLSYLLAICPSLASYSRDGITGWQHVVATAQLVRSMLGISPDAWQRACEAMGEIPAAITVAAILERSDSIHSPGGYLRALTERAENGKFSLRPMLSALEKS